MNESRTVAIRPLNEMDLDDVVAIDEKISGSYRPEVWERHHRTARTASAMLVHGTLQHEGQIIHVLAHRLEDLSPLLVGADFKARNFH